VTYEEVIKDHLSPGFDYGELVKPGNRRFVLPPKHMWRRMFAPLALANRLRDRMMELGAGGLVINAAYRPLGGAPNSQHKFNRALDLDLLPQDMTEAMKSMYYEEAVRLWVSAGEHRVGLGLYCARDACAGRRVHLDVGYRTRTWQHGYAAGSPDALLIAERLGLEVP